MIAIQRLFTKDYISFLIFYNDCLVCTKTYSEGSIDKIMNSLSNWINNNEDKILAAYLKYYIHI